MDYEVGIVGAGFGGVIAALSLNAAKRDSYIIFERADEIGGVWRDNHYPGCACDVRSDLYSIASEPNPAWTSSYASQPEILAYLKGVAGKHNLREKIRTASLVTEVRYCNPGFWEITEATGRRTRVRSLVLATGPQNRPAIPAIPGIDRYQRISFHSSAWGDTAQLAGKRVAVIGTGASAIQIVPNIASSVSELTVFQRTPAWILPRGDRKASGLGQWAFQRLPALQGMSRAAIYWSMEFIGLAFLGNEALHRVLTRIALRKIAREVHDPALRAQLTPAYKLGCKRVLVSDDFYPSFNRPNVRLVVDPIESITPTGIQTRGTHREVDAIVFATGFNVAGTEGFLRIVGQGGRVLTDDWNRDGPAAYLGINVSGYPNLALLLGPNSGLGHSSALHVMESQMTYVLQYLAEVERTGALDVRAQVQERYSENLQRKLAATVWASGCRSWYLNSSGRNSTLYPGLTADYRRVTAHFDPNNYATVS